MALRETSNTHITSPRFSSPKAADAPKDRFDTLTQAVEVADGLSAAKQQAPTTAAAPATQRPSGAEQLFGHAPTSQPAPLKPGAQLHSPVAVSQRPRAEQSRGQSSRSTGSIGSGRWRKQSSPR